MKRWLLIVSILGSPLWAQDMASAPGGTLRLLDKITGRIYDLPLSIGQAAVQGRLTVRLDDCRYPKDNPASDGQAHVTIMEEGRSDPVFAGWMIASSPALSAMDHPRYDVWVLSCDSGFVAPDVTPAPDTPDTPVPQINEG